MSVQKPLLSIAQAHNRLHAQHYALKTLLGSNILAPLVAPGDILDVGYGEGLWALDVAQPLPTSRVVGLERSPLRQFSYYTSNFLWDIQSSHLEYRRDT